MHKLSIIIPAYNEEKTIQQLLAKVDAVDLTKYKTTMEIIIVDDGSKDKTVEKIRELKKPYTIIQQEKNQGKGAAIRKGIEHATGDIILIQDADLEYDPNDYGKLIEPIITNKAKVVYGSRRLQKTNVQYSGLSFYLGGHTMTFLTNLLYNTAITDEPTCYKVFAAEVIKNIPLQCKRFEFCPEITAKVLKRGIPIYEVPISYYPRSVKEGKKIRWKDGLEGIWTLIKYKFVD